MAHLEPGRRADRGLPVRARICTTRWPEGLRVPVDEVDAEQRRRIKAMSYGLAYGLSA